MKQRNLLKYFFIFLVFTGAFIISLYYQKDDLTKEFLAATQKVPSIVDFNSTGPSGALKIVDSYGLLASLGIGLVAFVVSVFLLVILQLIRLAKYSLANIIALFLVYGAYLVLSIELMYYELRYTVLANAIVFFVGHPLFYAAITALVATLLIYLYSMIAGSRKKKADSEKVDEPVKPSETVSAPNSNIALLLLCFILPFFLSGCSLIGWLEGNACDVSKDPHCFQGAAVDQGDADECAKVTQPADFKSAGSNPPKDKCYLMVAENTGNLEACNKIQGGMFSYTREECILGASVANENPSGCKLLSGGDREECVAKLGGKITPEKVLEVDSQIDILKTELLKGSDPNLEKQLQGLQTKRDDMLGVMTAENKTSYNKQTDPLNKEVIGDWAVGAIDNATKNKMIGMNENLKAQGVTMTKEQYVALRDYYKYVNDPENNIETMSDANIVKQGIGDKVSNVVDKLKFWKVKDTTEEKQEDQQLRFYQKMLERQEAIDQGLTVKEQAYENTIDKIKEKVEEKSADMAKEKVIEHIFGEATGLTTKVTTAVLGEAIDEVKAEAKSEEFRGLVNAYDDGMKEELGKFGGNVDKAHEEVVKKLMADPYSYATGDSFAKYGNIIENKDCDGTNPHCLNKEVFWKAMKKSYKYQNQN